MLRGLTQLPLWRRIIASNRSSEAFQFDRLRRSFFAGLLVIAVLAILNFVVLHQAIYLTQTSIDVVNLAGRQRTLSQRIALFAQLLTTASTPDERDTARRELREAADLMETSHDALVQGDTNLDGVSELSDRGYALYFDPPLQIDSQVRAFIGEARSLVEVADAELSQNDPHAQFLISQATGPLLSAFDALVRFYEDESLRDTTNLEVLQVAALGFIVLTLVFETIFIFGPLITQLQREGVSLNQERALLRTLIDNIPDYIFAKDREGRFLISNIAHAKAVQVPNPDDLVGRPASDFFPLELATQFDADDQAIMRSGEALISLERVTVDAEGNRVNVSTTKVPLRDTKGEVIGLVGISRDITRRKKAEDALRRSEALYRLLAESLPGSAVLLYDHDLRFLIAAGAILAETGYHPELMEGKTLQEIVPPESYVTLAPHYQAALRGERIQSELPTSGKIYLTNFLPVKTGNDEIFAGMLLITDITERRQAEAHEIELGIERQRVSVLNHFIRDASHEFWTPLSIIQTSLHLLERTLEMPRQKERVQTLREQANYIERLVNDLLLMSRLDSDFEFQFNATDLNVLLEDLSTNWQALMGEKKLSFTHSFSGNIPPLKIDLEMFPLALGNLIKNAVSFTPAEGTISLKSYRDGDHVAIQVNDTGMGMSPEIVSHIFERFYRGDAARTERGSGLGLAVCQKIIEAHDGTIQVESTPGLGSCFTVRLPLANGLTADS